MATVFCFEIIVYFTNLEEKKGARVTKRLGKVAYKLKEKQSGGIFDDDGSSRNGLREKLVKLVCPIMVF